MVAKRFRRQAGNYFIKNRLHEFAVDLWLDGNSTKGGCPLYNNILYVLHDMQFVSIYL